MKGPLNRKAVAAVAVVLSLAVLPAAWAGGPDRRYDPGTMTLRELTFGNLRDGYKIFRESCKSCHHRGNAAGARFLYTESKTMRGWNRVFYERRARCDRDGAWKGLSADDLLKLNDYLFHSASDAQDVSCFV